MRDKVVVTRARSHEPCVGVNAAEARAAILHSSSALGASGLSRRSDIRCTNVDGGLGGSGSDNTNNRCRRASCARLLHASVPHHPGSTLRSCSCVVAACLAVSNFGGADMVWPDGRGRSPFRGAAGCSSFGLARPRARSSCWSRDWRGGCTVRSRQFRHRVRNGKEDPIGSREPIRLGRASLAHLCAAVGARPRHTAMTESGLFR